MTRKWIGSAALVLALAFAGPAWAQVAAAPAKMDKASQKFIVKAIEGNLAEVQMGQLAQQKGNSDGVRSFGQTLQQDHSSAAQKASGVANQVGVTPPTEPNKKQKAMHASLSKLSGDAFDKKFTSEMVKDHKKDIAEYKSAAKKNDPVGAYAKDALPTLEKHLEMAQSLAGAKKR